MVMYPLSGVYFTALWSKIKQHLIDASHIHEDLGELGGDVHLDGNMVCICLWLYAFSCAPKQLSRWCISHLQCDAPGFDL